MNTLTKNHIDQLDEPEAFLSAFEPTYAVVIKQCIRPGEAPLIYYVGQDGSRYKHLTPKLVYGYQQAHREFQKCTARMCQPRNHSVVGVEIQHVNSAVAQKNLDDREAKREANRLAYQREKERALLRAEQLGFHKLCLGRLYELAQRGSKSNKLAARAALQAQLEKTRFTDILGQN